ncbi:hypothetical protein CTAYLR_007703 [Chrysophaeum taylorii]|uniref:PA domain-containing protein n=1 Tax=Chrysophaeum taylorii TaxID=2483200 RepID=A0AAD7U675_9STRA|nr:hypothetical protein CTAYLR_007703 [Chrysophaeum taylorii]
MRRFAAWALIVAKAAIVVVAKKEAIEIDETALPPFEAFIADVGLGEHLPRLQRRGYDRTRQLLKWGRSEVQLLRTELNFSQEVGATLLERLDDLKARATKRQSGAASDELAALREERDALTYGRLVVNRSMASFDYKRAWFGAALPHAHLGLLRAVPTDACRPLAASYEGKIVLADRGGCDFVTKAWHAHAKKARALIVVNKEGQLFERPASGHATDATVAPTPDTLAVAMVDAAAGPALAAVATAPLVNNKNLLETLSRADRRMIRDAARRNLEATDAVDARFVPLRCRAGEPECKPLLPDELELPANVDSGYVFVAQEDDNNSSPVEFVAASWGGVVPTALLPLVRAVPGDLCAPPPNWFASAAPGAAILAARGNCDFRSKASHAAALGGAALIIAQTNDDEPLLRMGVRTPPLPPAIPAVLIDRCGGAVLMRALDASSSSSAAPRVRLTAANPGFAHQWLELESIGGKWAEDDAAAQLQLQRHEAKNLDSPTRLEWLRRSFANRTGTTCQEGDGGVCAAEGRPQDASF